ncbi:ROK family protein [Sphingomonas glacialis]|uniref:fructokinase n=1 Tax=Sphingomonas glacialis TaxID=658225 RepID=A0A502FY27_9SPHN|nr:ROK family protein [Sphingomonas glacialis]TPG54418.1 ROK family protein [Sphingomonas glacialis]
MSAPLIAGVELGGTKVICVLASGPNDVRDRVQIPTTTPDETLGAVEDVLRRWSGYDALGIASFGPVSLDRSAATYGFITSTPKPGWSDTDVAMRLATVAGVPLGFDSDVNGAALGEGRWGAAHDVADHAYMTVGTGVGVGLVLGGAPVSGMTHAELGHVRPVRMAGDGWAGSCPFHGDCVEGLVSGPAIRARTGTAAQDLAARDPVWETVAHTLAQLCHTLVLTGIPRRIVMGGGVVVGVPHLLPEIRTRLVASLGGYVAAPALLPIDDFVVPAGLGGMAGPLGAVQLGVLALERG